MEPRLPRFGLVAFATLLAFAFAYRLDSPALFEDPNDGQYAEVAREMLQNDDWVSPTLNGVLFLNKPPLLYWLIASSYAAFGVSEFAARLPGALVGMLTLLLLYGLGREIFDPRTALAAVAVYAGMPGTLIEARAVRPDGLLTASVVAALWALAVALRSEPARRRRALYAMQVALACGVLAKGIVALLLPGFAVAALILAERRSDLLRALASPRSWLLFLLLVAPWHVAASLRHEGFAWDYVVQQHFLFFLDRKEPRDSTGIPLGLFWAAFLGRAFPWTLYLPMAALYLMFVSRTDPRCRRGGLLILAWLVGVLGFFSAAPSRLEHYVLPALPAVCLMVGLLFARPSTPGSAWRKGLAVHHAVLAAALVAAVWIVPSVLTQVDWLSSRQELVMVARVFHLLLALGAVVALALWPRRPHAFVPLVAGSVLLAVPIVHRGLEAIAPINSSAPVADVVRAEIARGPAEVVFEAPTEYQHVAGLDFYLGQTVTLLRPPGFVAPAYLEPHLDALFIDRAELERRWRTTRVIFVSDPLAPAGRPLEAIVPAPFAVLAESVNRWVLTNRPVSEGAPREDRAPGD